MKKLCLFSVGKKKHPQKYLHGLTQRFSMIGLYAVLCHITFLFLNAMLVSDLSGIELQRLFIPRLEYSIMSLLLVIAGAFLLECQLREIDKEANEK